MCKSEVYEMQVIISGKHLDVGDALRAYTHKKIEHCLHKFFKDGQSNSNAKVTVIISKQRHFFHVVIEVHIASHLKPVVGEGTSTAPYQSVNQAISHIDRCIRSYKEKLGDHHRSSKAVVVAQAKKYVVPPRMLRANMDEDGQWLDGEGANSGIREEAMPDGAASFAQLGNMDKMDGQVTNIEERSEESGDILGLVEISGKAVEVIAEKQVDIEVMEVEEAIMRMDLGHLPAYMFINNATHGISLVYYRRDGNIAWIDSGIRAN